MKLYICGADAGTIRRAVVTSETDAPARVGVSLARYTPEVRSTLSFIQRIVFITI